MSEFSGKCSQNMYIYNVYKSSFLRVMTQTLCILTLILCPALCLTPGAIEKSSTLGRVAEPATQNMPAHYEDYFELKVLEKQQMQERCSDLPFSS